ncbi:hypothetical protein VB776_23795 [Arcicella sp. DC2W]|uniref:Transglutaminase-like domain-containing protein n=1 Tax=Arcicella gelida TaxID=2984195 RepID=A0ABU5SBY6_9BACT|nr:hypothetical protein [Arcicella sp. DC2W]MEA5405983.1 hypothetical protein [Arcicella sp. DC2W]
MLDKAENYQSHLDYFSSKKIDVTHPGFYDDEKFIKLEQTNPNLLDNYASFVSQKVFNKDYLSNAERVIKKTAELLFEQLHKDGRQGACTDASMAMSRILEKEGIWNYQVKGSLTITFPNQTNIKRKYFWSVDQGNYVAAHSWLIAPPYKIIDITVRQQAYKQGETQFLPNLILKKETKFSTLELEDIVEPNLLSLFYNQYGKNKTKIINAISPNLQSFSNLFKPEVVEENGVIFKYSSTGIVAPDLPFEQATSLKLNGLYGIDIYNKIIKPQLQD